jgi:hypothetical protein
MNIPTIISKYRGEKSLRTFAAEVSERMPEPITYQTIKNWEDEVTRPSYYFMLAIALHNDDWRRTMALEILAVLKPGYYTPDQLKIIT